MKQELDGSEKRNFHSTWLRQFIRDKILNVNGLTKHGKQIFSH